MTPTEHDCLCCKDVTNVFVCVCVTSVTCLLLSSRLCSEAALRDVVYDVVDCLKEVDSPQVTGARSHRAAAASV